MDVEHVHIPTAHLSQGERYHDLERKGGRMPSNEIE